MGSVIEVKPETANRLHTMAAGKGVSVDELLRAFVPGLVPNGTAASSQGDKVALFVHWARTHPTDTPLLSDESVSRKSFYER